MFPCEEIRKTSKTTIRGKVNKGVSTLRKSLSLVNPCVITLRTSEILLFYNLFFFYWHFLEILWFYIFLLFYKYSFKINKGERFPFYSQRYPKVDKIQEISKGSFLFHANKHQSNDEETKALLTISLVNQSCLVPTSYHLLGNTPAFSISLFVMQLMEVELEAAILYPYL